MTWRPRLPRARPSPLRESNTGELQFSFKSLDAARTAELPQNYCNRRAGALVGRMMDECVMAPVGPNGERPAEALGCKACK